jgi:hypothetical protein
MDRRMSGLVSEREVINRDLREARDRIDSVTNQEAVWGECAEYPDVVAAIAETQRSLNVTLRQAVGFWREAGASWQDIGAALGMSRQAAQQRYT